MEESKTPQAPAGLEKAEIWKMLVETAHALPMYKNQKRYLEDVMIKEAPKISPQELAVQLNIPVGEAMVMLDEVRGGKLAKSEGHPEASLPKVSDRTLMDFRG